MAQLNNGMPKSSSRMLGRRAKQMTVAAYRAGRTSVKGFIPRTTPRAETERYKHPTDTGHIA